MRKGIICILILGFAVLTFGFAFSSSELFAQIVDFKIQVNGSELNLTKPIVVIENNAYVPIREVAENMGMTVDWDGESRTISINGEVNESELYPFEVDGLWGYKNVQGEIIAEAKYFSANEFSEGRGLIQKASGQNGEYGFVDITGKEVIPCIYYMAYDFCDGAALVSLAEHTDYDRWTYIDVNGEYLFNQEFVLAKSFSEGYAAVLKEGYGAPTPFGNENSKWSYIDKSGSYATELTFEEVRDFKNGCAIVKNYGKWGAINNEFELILPYQYADIEEAKNALNERQR